MIPCYECGQCNHKGKPSVSRGSAYCDSHIKQGIKVNRIGLFDRFKDYLFQRRVDLEQKKFKTDKEYKGFRPSWFWR